MSAIQRRSRVMEKKSQNPGISMISPTTSPAKKAPGTLPNPPSATTVKAIMVKISPT